MRQQLPFDMATLLQLCQSTHLIGEIGIRLALGICLFITEHMHPRYRDIHPEEWWLYKNHPSDSYVPGWLLWLSILFIIPLGLYCLTALWPIAPLPSVNEPANRQSPSPALTCQLAYWLTILLAGNLTNVIKLIVGRPRPDYFYRCYPDDHEHEQQQQLLATPCFGEPDAIIEGRKSFPSGHSAFSFASLGLVSLLLWRKFGVWRFSAPSVAAWQLLLGSLPLFLAMCVALSRLVDYHHHCEDIVVGSFLGFCVAYSCYRLYYPALSQSDCSDSIGSVGLQKSPSALLAMKVFGLASASSSGNVAAMQSASNEGSLFQVRSM